MSTFVAVDVAETGETFPTFTPADVLSFFLYSNTRRVQIVLCVGMGHLFLCDTSGMCAVVRTARAGTLQTVSRR